MLEMLALTTLIVRQVSCQNSDWDYLKGGDDWEGVCASGKSQSPIDLSDDILTIITSEDNVYEVELDFVGEFSGQFAKGDTGSLGIGGAFGTVRINDLNITVFNFHFHSPSEHTINGDYLDIELHFVGRDQNSKTYEMVFWFNAGGDENKFIKNAIDSYSESKSKSFDTAWLMENGAVDNFYYYDGSITAPLPDCYESTGWMMVADILEMSNDQLDFFSDMYKNNDTFAGGRGNNRKIQSLNGRKVYLYEVDNDSSSLFVSSIIPIAGLILF